MISKLRAGWSGDWTKPFGGFYKMKPGYLTLNEGAGPVNLTWISKTKMGGHTFIYIHLFGLRITCAGGKWGISK